MKASIDFNVYAADGTQLIVPGLVHRAQIPAAPAAARRWALARGGAGMVSHLDVTLEGRHSPSVVIRQIRATVSSRQRPLSGTLLTIPGAEGSADSVNLAFDLGEAVPVARRAGPGAGPHEPYFAGRYITLGPGEQVVLKVEVWPGANLCTWRLDLDVVAGSASQTISLPGDGQSFRTTPERPNYQAEYEFQPIDQAWVTTGD
ncbi:hypothetical protein ACQP2E_10235 [Actinoplanes sp. CA-015351]|uniref:hypothetical protein n=1 Tax=Actinoplanes sp. CA-015351 TaxID=3239897 RepID=UPI003D99A796